MLNPDNKNQVLRVIMDNDEVIARDVVGDYRIIHSRVRLGNIVHYRMIFDLDLGHYIRDITDKSPLQVGTEVYPLDDNFEVLIPLSTVNPYLTQAFEVILEALDIES
jgi:predicted RNA-binding protein